MSATFATTGFRATGDVGLPEEQQLPAIDRDRGGDHPAEAELLGERADALGGGAIAQAADRGRLQPRIRPVIRCPSDRYLSSTRSADQAPGAFSP